MRVLIAPQEYKGTLTAVEAADAIAAALRDAFSDIETDLAPMADGGPGTVEALLRAIGGEWHKCPAHDPLMRLIEASWARLSSGVAVIECAAASGLLRLSPAELDPRRASTYGTGELIAAALDAGCRELIVGLGGSATNDGGAGMAQALGYRLLDGTGRDLERGGAALSKLARIDGKGANPSIEGARFLAATDVTNPLCGPDGASAVYGPQKGADNEAVRELDAALRHLADLVLRDLGVDVLDVAGAGAAGGLGAGVLAFLGARIESGAAVVGQAARLPQRVALADIVITGEGRLDGQTAFGKAPSYVAGLARAAGKPVICLPGSLGAGHEGVTSLFDAVRPLTDGSGLPDKAQSKALLASASAEALSKFGIGRAQG
jgi:glycerate kinase